MQPFSMTFAHRTALAVIILMLISALYAGDSVWIKRDGYEQLRQGVAADGGQNLYVSRKGRIQTINRQDLNLDGELDLVFTQDHDSVYAPDSLIYWGGPQGFHSLLPEMWQMRAPFSVLTWLDKGKTRISRIPTMGGGRSKIADLNLDGHLDLVFANFMHNYRSDQQSLIYWGSDSGFSPSNRTELPTFLASGVTVGDLNGDGLPEVILSNRGDERGDIWGYRLHLEFQVRSAAEEESLRGASWQGPSGSESFFTESPAALSGLANNHDWLQYRVYLTSADGGNTPYLEEVSVECE